MNKVILRDSLQIASTMDAYASEPKIKGILYEKMTDDYGNVLLKKIDHNTVVVGGAVTTLSLLTGKSPSWQPNTLNSIYNLNTGVVADGAPHILLFGIGIGGSGLNFGSVVPKDIKSTNIPSMVPMRVNSGGVLSGTDAAKYFFKLQNSETLNYEWYLKEFASEVSIKTCWKDAPDDEADGTEIISDISSSTRTEDIQSFADFNISLNTSDIREYFETIGELDSARYNTIGLYTGQKVEITPGVYDYVNVRLFSYLNIDNTSLKIKTSSEYVYRILTLV